jgi:imidazolonepropionase-like amidohydrolase
VHGKGSAAAGRTALANVRVFDGRGLREPSTVIIDDGRIGTGTQGARILDGNGGIVLPGLIDAHVHLQDVTTLRTLAGFGVTTALDMGCWPPGLVSSLREQPGLTDIRSSQVGATSPASRHSQALADRPAEGLVRGPGDADRYVADRIAEGADYIKIIIDLPGFDQETVTALAAAARARGKLTIAHVTSCAAVEMAQQADIDVLTHAPLDAPLGKAAAARMRADGRVIVPTLTMMEAVVANLRQAGLGGPSGPAYEPARDSVAALHQAGVPIVAGSDANLTAGVPASPPFGESLHHELELLVDAGLSSVDALRAATVVPAGHFGLPDRGAIMLGMRADLVLLAGDPIGDIRATRQIRQVWCAGVAQFPE